MSEEGRKGMGRTYCGRVVGKHNYGVGTFNYCTFVSGDGNSCECNGVCGNGKKEGCQCNQCYQTDVDNGLFSSWVSSNSRTYCSQVVGKQGYHRGTNNFCAVDTVECHCNGVCGPRMGCQCVTCYNVDRAAGRLLQMALTADFDSYYSSSDEYDPTTDRFEDGDTSSTLQVYNGVVSGELELNSAELEDKTTLHDCWGRCIVHYAAADQANPHLFPHLLTPFLSSHLGTIDYPDTYGATMLWIASQHGNLPTVIHLHQQGSDIELADGKYNRTPLRIACKRGHLDVVKYLFHHGATFETSSKDAYSPMLIACQKGHLEVVKFLLENGAEIDQPGLDGSTPLIIAAEQGHLPVVQYLVQQGADLNAVDSHRTTPLAIACHHGHVPTAKYLCEQSADKELPDAHGLTPLHVAVSCGELSLVKYLHEQGASVHTVNISNRSPLWFACFYTSLVDIGKYLVETAGVDINVPDNAGWTPFVVCCFVGNLEMVKCLYEWGAVVDLDVCLLDPLTLATQEGHYSVVEFIYNHFDEITTTNNWKACTALSGAVENGLLSAVEFLWEKGAGTEYSHTVPEMTGKGNHAVVEFFVGQGAVFEPGARFHLTHVAGCPWLM